MISDVHPSLGIDSLEEEALIVQMISNHVRRKIPHLGKNMHYPEHL